MVFFLGLLILGIVFSKVKIDINSIRASIGNNSKSKINDLDIAISFYLFLFIRIIKIVIEKDYIKINGFKIANKMVLDEKNFFSIIKTISNRKLILKRISKLIICFKYNFSDAFATAIAFPFLQSINTALVKNKIKESKIEIIPSFNSYNFYELFLKLEMKLFLMDILFILIKYNILDKGNNNKKQKERKYE